MHASAATAQHGALQRNLIAKAARPQLVHQKN